MIKLFLFFFCNLNHSYFVFVSFIRVTGEIDYSFNDVYFTKTSIMLWLSRLSTGSH